MDPWIVEKECKLLPFLKGKLKHLYKGKEVQWAVEHNRCLVNGKIERFISTNLRRGDAVVLFMEERKTFALEAKRILYEDENVLCYNKPSGIASTGERSLESLLKLLPVHRLDRDTTGVILFAKNKKTQILLEDLFKQRKIEKSYVAIVRGSLKRPKGIIQNQMGITSRRQGEVTWGIVPRGLTAETHWQCLKAGRDLSFVRCMPLTGRTHQLRVHLNSIGHPILGDFQYGGRVLHRSQVFRMLLHAEKISFSGITVIAPLPEDFQECLQTF